MVLECPLEVIFCCYRTIYFLAELVHNGHFIVGDSHFTFNVRHYFKMVAIFHQHNELDASVEIRSSIIIATLIIIVSFVPLFFLGGMERRLLKSLGIAFVTSILTSLGCGRYRHTRIVFLFVAKRTTAQQTC